MTTAPPTFEPDHDEDVKLSPVGWWGVGVVLGVAITSALAFLVLINMTSEPSYTNRADAAGGAAVAGEAVSDVTLIATEFAFDPDEFVGAEELTVTLDNAGVVIHNFVVEGVPESEFVVVAEAGQAATGVLRLPAGEYAFFCSIPGHREAGMEGVLSIAAGE